MLNKLTYALGIAGVAVVGGFLFWTLLPPAERDGADESTSSPVGADSDESLTLSTVVLTPEKIAAADIQVGAAQRAPLQSRRTIAGRLDYDQERHVAIKAACDGIVIEMQAHPGENVAVGQTVAVVSSPAVGSARSAVKMRLAELKLAETEKQWRGTICSGVEALVEMIRAERTPDEISKALQGDSLGEFREKLVSAYTRARLGQKVVDNTREAAQRGAIAVSVQQQRESELQSSVAALEGVLDQSLFEVRQQCNSSTAALAQAERQVEISLQELNTLLGPAAQPVTKEQFLNSNDQWLSNVNLISPIAGTIEERNLSVGERVSAGESVFVVADVSQLWAVADVRESDWEAIAVEVGQPVEISSPALGSQSFPGEVLFVGRRVDPATGAAPLIAKLDATDPRLRPGLFIRMTVPTTAPHEAVVVPEQAVVVHEGTHFVFVAESDSTFHRTDVTVGETQGGNTEIMSGLSPGQRVATSGVFKLKSELLLAGEEE